MRTFVTELTKDEQLELLRKSAEVFYLNESAKSPLEDEEYDYLEKKLGIRGLSLLGFKEIKVRTMDSKTQVKENFDEVISKLVNSDNLPKWDGCSLIAYYKYIEHLGESRLFKVVSKSSGLDKTKDFSYFFPESLDGDFSYLQGEAVVDLKHGFDERSRQKANGLVNSKSMQADIKKYITVVIFAGCSKGGIIPGCSCVSIDSPLREKYTFSPLYHDGKVVKNTFEFNDGRKFLIDGVVAYGSKINGYKFYYTDAAVTTIRKIKWQKSKYSNYTPVAIFDQVKIEGCKIEKSSVGSVDKMISRGIGIGSEVEIIRANSTIPKIKSVLTKSVDYGNCKCPVCGEPFDLKKSVGGKVRCWNPNCTEEYDRMMKLMKKSSIDTIDPKFINKLMNLERQKLQSSTIKSIIGLVMTVMTNKSFPDYEIHVPMDKLSSASKKLMTYKLDQLCKVLSSLYCM